MSATSATGHSFSCDIKAGAGLLPGATPKPGRIIASIATIEQATGLGVSQSVDISMVSGFTQCRYAVGDGGQVDITVLDDASRSAVEVAATHSRMLALHDRACNGCSLADISAAPQLGPQGYLAHSDGDPVLGAVAGGVYFEVEAVRLKEVRVERLVLSIAATLEGSAAASLPPLPTPTP